MPRMFYFGPWDRPGHFLFGEDGSYVPRTAEAVLPWTLGQMDGGLQPHRPGCTRPHYCGCGSSEEGVARLHYANGWTALAFWDRSVDTRGNCCSVYLAEGTYSFEEMVALSAARFRQRWARMLFTVRLEG